ADHTVTRSIQRRSSCQEALALKNELLLGCQPHAAPFFRPGRPGPSVVVQDAGPGPHVLATEVVAAQIALGHIGAKVLAQKCAQFLAELVVSGIEIKIHREDSCCRMTGSKFVAGAAKEKPLLSGNPPSSMGPYRPL